MRACKGIDGTWGSRRYGDGGQGECLLGRKEEVRRDKGGGRVGGGLLTMLCVMHCTRVDHFFASLKSKCLNIYVYSVLLSL